MPTPCSGCGQPAPPYAFDTGAPIEWQSFSAVTAAWCALAGRVGNVGDVSGYLLAKPVRHRRSRLKHQVGKLLQSRLIV